jgi:hypothetical protein
MCYDAPPLPGVEAAVVDADRRGSDCASDGVTACGDFPDHAAAPDVRVAVSITAATAEIVSDASPITTTPHVT